MAKKKYIAVHEIHGADPDNQGQIKITKPGQAYVPVDAKQEEEFVRIGAIRATQDHEALVETALSAGIVGTAADASATAQAEMQKSEMREADRINAAAAVAAAKPGSDVAGNDANDRDNDGAGSAKSTSRSGTKR